MNEGVIPETGGLAVQTFACVWDALTDSPAEAMAMRLRSDLLSAIRQTVASWGTTRAAAARRLELTRPRLEELLRGSLGKFSFDDLIQLASRADLDVRVQIGGPVATDPKMHFSPVLLLKGLDPENGAAPEPRTNPNGTEKVFHADVPLGSASTGPYPPVMDSSHWLTASSLWPSRSTTNAA